MIHNTFANIFTYFEKKLPDYAETKWRVMILTAMQAVPLQVDYDYGESNVLQTVFRWFVCVSLTALLGFHAYGYMWPQADSLEGDFADIKYVVMQLTRGLAEVNRKHEHLKGEMERVSAVLPVISLSSRRESLTQQPLRRSFRQQAIDTVASDYDRQIADYALETAGARVIDTGETVEHKIFDSPFSYALHVMSSLLCRDCMNARALIRPGTLPGECWAFKGSRGEVLIRLLGTVEITGLSLEHIPSHISPTGEISSAPRLFQLEGLDYRNDQYPHDFGSFEYDKNGKAIQYFEVRHPSNKGYNLVRLRVISNWGHPVYTCVYRLRVHGRLAQGQIQSQAQAQVEDLRIENE